MKYGAAILVLFVVIVGCGSAGAPESSAAPEKPKVMPGAVGITSGQSGTGTTSGASTGY